MLCTFRFHPLKLKKFLPTTAKYLKSGLMVQMVEPVIMEEQMKTVKLTVLPIMTGKILMP
jgi:hypothetical protein